MASTQSLLLQIEDGVSDDGVSLTSLLRKCIVLGGKEGSEKLRDWASRELRGYLGVAHDDLPEYRRVRAMICVDAISMYSHIERQPWGASQLPDVVKDAGFDDELALRQGLGEIENMLGSGQSSFKLLLPDSEVIARLITAELPDSDINRVYNVYWLVGPAVLGGVVDRVRTALAELVAELRANSTRDGKLATGDVDRALNIVVGGRGNSVNVNSSSGSSTLQLGPAKSGEGRETMGGPGAWWTRWRKRGIVVGISTFVAAVAGIGAWIGWNPFA